MNEIRVLLVDDEALVLSSLRRLLAREEFDVSTAHSGAAGLLHLETNEVDLVLSDYKMPGMTGLQFLEEVRRRWPRPRRIILTAQAEPREVEKALANGLLFRALTKPWDNHELVQVLRDAFASPSGACVPSS